MIVTIEKEPSVYFQQFHFGNQWVPLIERQCGVGYLLDFDLKIRSGQVCICIITKKMTASNLSKMENHICESGSV